MESSCFEEKPIASFLESNEKRLGPSNSSVPEMREALDVYSATNTNPGKEDNIAILEKPEKRGKR
jgi:hypothetical protein